MDATITATISHLIAAIRAMPDTPVTGWQPGGNTSHSYAEWCEAMPPASRYDQAWTLVGLAVAHGEVVGIVEGEG